MNRFKYTIHITSTKNQELLRTTRSGGTPQLSYSCMKYSIYTLMRCCNIYSINRSTRENHVWKLCIKLPVFISQHVNAHMYISYWWPSPRDGGGDGEGPHCATAGANGEASGLIGFHRGPESGSQLWGDNCATTLGYIFAFWGNFAFLTKYVVFHYMCFITFRCFLIFSVFFFRNL